MTYLNTTKDILVDAVTRISVSEDAYKDFLRTSAWNFKYRLVDRLLIFAQKPEAIACAEADIWERPNLGRMIKKDAFAIALLQNNQIRHVYDVGDTLAVDQTKPFYLWELTGENKEKTLQELQKAESILLHGATDLETCIELLTEARLMVAEEHYLPTFLEYEQIDETAFHKSYHDFLKQSVLFMVNERLGLNQKREDVDFSALPALFTSRDSLLTALAMEKAASENILREFAPIVQKYTPIPTKEKIRKEDYYEYNTLQAGRPISGADIRGNQQPNREIWTDETGLSDVSQRGEVHHLPDEGNTGSASAGSGSESERTGEHDNGQIDETISITGQEEHAAVDQPHEFTETDCGGTGHSGTDLQLEKIDYILSYDKHLKHTNEELLAVLFDPTVDQQTKLDFLKESYDESYTAFYYLDDEANDYVGYHREEDGLFMWEGNFLTRTAEAFMLWEDVLDYHLQKMISPLKQSAPDPLEITEDEIEAAVCSGSGFVNGKYRIYCYFQEKHSAKEKADFLKEEYGMGGRTGIGDGPNISYDAKGIQLRKGYSPQAPKVLLPWSKVEKRIAKLIENGQYLTEKESEKLPLYINDRQLAAIGAKLINEFQLDVPYEKYFYDLPNNLTIMCSTPEGKALVERALDEALLKDGENAELAELSTQFKSLQPYSESRLVPWSSLDWELQRKAEASGNDVLVLQEDDIVMLGETRYIVTGSNNGKYMLQSEEFPLNFNEYTEAKLKTLLRQNSYNDQYFVSEEKREVDSSLAGRLDRLIEHLSPEGAHNCKFVQKDRLQPVLSVSKSGENIHFTLYDDNGSLLTALEGTAEQLTSELSFIYYLVSGISGDTSCYQVLPQAKETVTESISRAKELLDDMYKDTPAALEPEPFSQEVHFR